MNQKPIDILIVEDTSSDAEILQRLLRNSSIRSSSVLWVQSIAEATDAIQKTSFDLVLTDLGLPDSSGIETVAGLKELSNRFPVIALTGQDDDALGLAAIQAGASDYISKGTLSEAMGIETWLQHN